MIFNEYMPMAMETAIFRDKEVQINCSLLGLMGETAELIEKIESFNPVDDIEIKKEFGDIFWYMASLFDSFNMDAQYWTARTDIDENFGMSIDDVDLAFFGFFYETIKKAYRENPYDCFDSHALSFIGANLSALYHIICKTITNMEFDVEEILQMNLDKLSDRKDRGVLHSSGDSR